MTLSPNLSTAPTAGDNGEFTHALWRESATGSFTARRGGLFAVILSGEIDPLVEPDLEALVAQLRAGSSASATVDLRAVTFFGSTGLNFVSRLQQISRGRGGSVTMLGSSRVCLWNAILGFDTTFDLAG